MGGYDSETPVLRLGVSTTVGRGWGTETDTEASYEPTRLDSKSEVKKEGLLTVSVSGTGEGPDGRRGRRDGKGPSTERQKEVLTRSSVEGPEAQKDEWVMSDKKTRSV